MPYVLAALFMGLLLGGGGALSDAPRTLDDVIATVTIDNPDIEQMAPEALKALMAENAPFVIFDVREEAEYAVSRLPGAVRVDPGLWQSTFVQRYGSLVKDKIVVFYCSVGVRSSRLAARVQDVAPQLGARSIHNLAGGIFRWHGEKRTLVDTRGATDAVHPYNATWGKLLPRPEGARMTPTPQ